MKVFLSLVAAMLTLSASAEWKSLSFLNSQITSVTVPTSVTLYSLDTINETNGYYFATNTIGAWWTNKQPYYSTSAWGGVATNLIPGWQFYTTNTDYWKGCAATNVGGPGTFNTSVRTTNTWGRWYTTSNNFPLFADAELWNPGTVVINGAAGPTNVMGNICLRTCGNSNKVTVTFVSVPDGISGNSVLDHYWSYTYTNNPGNNSPEYTFTIPLEAWRVVGAKKLRLASFGAGTAANSVTLLSATLNGWAP